MNDTDKENEATTGKCAECGGETPARDTHQCAACHVTLCESCVETCHDCGVGLCHGCYEECQCAETLCHDCALPCSACGRMLLCSDCAVRCDVCDDPLCSDCEYRCEDCDCALCYECVYDLDGDYAYCSDCWNSRRQEPYYVDSPCWLKMQEHKHMLTIGLEIEINGAHGQSRLKESPLIAGWCTDLSLDDEGREYQTRILTREDFDAIYGLVRGIHTESREPDKAGGHMHLRRTSRQTPSRWYWALKGLSDQQARNLNMRHTSNNRWCELIHGDYDGKHTAVNGCHENTIELRTFARWDETTAHRLIPALEWASHMWRHFESHDLYQLKTADIMRESARSAYPLEDQTTRRQGGGGTRHAPSTPYRRNGKTRANHGRRATGSPAPPRPPRPEPGRTPPPAGGDGGWGGPERPPVPGLQPPPRHGPSDVPTLPIRRTGERLMERPRDGRVRGRGTITRAATTRRNHRRAAWGPRRPARRRPPAAARTTPSAREAHNPGRAPPNRNRRRTSRA